MRFNPECWSRMPLFGGIMLSICFSNALFFLGLSLPYIIACSGCSVVKTLDVVLDLQLLSFVAVPVFLISRLYVFGEEYFGKGVMSVVLVLVVLFALALGRYASF